MMLKIFRDSWPTPPKLSRSQYRRHRLRCLVFLLTWVSFGVGLYLIWGYLNLILQIILILVGAAFSPGVDMVERLFVSYEKYEEEGPD